MMTVDILSSCSLAARGVERGEAAGGGKKRVKYHPHMAPRFPHR